MFKSRSKASYKLGIYKAPAGLRGALVRHQDGKNELIRLFGGSERSFSENGSELSSVSVGPGFADSFATDRNGSGRFGATQGGDGYAAILGGDGSAGVPDVFLSSEFGRMPLTASEPVGVGQDLLKEDLAKILARCREMGAEDLEVVWCLGTSHFSWAEVSATAKQGGLKKGRHRDPSVTIEAPAGDGSIRLIECTPRKDEPASAVIESLRATPGQPGMCVVDSEVTSFLALMKSAEGEDDGVSLLVRLSEDDLLVVATRDGHLQQVDVLRSLSVHDGPEMLYSRLLLLLDEFGLPNIDRLFIASLEEDPRFVDTFQTYFRGVEVADLRDKLGRITRDERIEGEALPAIGAALRHVLDLKPEENMLAPLLRKPRQSNPFSLQVTALLGLLALTAVFFVARYAHYDREISARHNRIQALTHDTQTALLLRHRIDSLQAAYSVNMQGLQVIDSLLVGSDKWTRTFDETATAMSQVGGIWMDKWQPAGSIVDISGGARTRAGVVELARLLNGTIETITYPSGEVTHYSFRMKAPVVVELPEAARYLRERAAQVTQL